MNATLPIIQSLWIGESLTVMEKLSISSFLQKGHPFHLYVYDKVEGIPDGTLIKDAAEILPPEKIFKYKDRDSYSGFSNLFRYKLLLERGNYWVDMDMVCLKPFSYDKDYVFSAQRPQENTQKKPGFFTRFFQKAFTIEEKAMQAVNKLEVCSCIIKTPANSQIMDYCYNESLKKDPDTLKWGQTGPDLLTEAVKKFAMAQFVNDPEIFCPVNWWNWEQLLNPQSEMNLLENSTGVHLWNEMWRKNEVNKTGDFPENCIYEQLKTSLLDATKPCNKF